MPAMQSMQSGGGAGGRAFAVVGVVGALVAADRRLVHVQLLVRVALPHRAPEPRVVRPQLRAVAAASARQALPNMIRPAGVSQLPYCGSALLLLCTSSKRRPQAVATAGKCQHEADQIGIWWRIGGKCCHP